MVMSQGDGRAAEAGVREGSGVEATAQAHLPEAQQGGAAAARQKQQQKRGLMSIYLSLFYSAVLYCGGYICMCIYIYTRAYITYIVHDWYVMCWLYVSGLCHRCIDIVIMSAMNELLIYMLAVLAVSYTCMSSCAYLLIIIN